MARPAKQQTARGPIAKLYHQLVPKRANWERRAEECAALTIPALFPREGWTGDRVPTTYQSVGARGVNNLAHKLSLTVLPPNAPAFRLDPDLGALRAQSKEEQAKAEQIKTEVTEALAKYERMATEHIESLGDRVIMSEALAQLLVSGNVCLNPEEDSLTVYTLRNFVCQRDPAGKPMLTIVRFPVDPITLPERIREKLVGQPGYPADTGEVSLSKTGNREIDVYTMCRRDTDRWEVTQEALGVTLAEAERHPLEAPPLFPIRAISMAGEDYGPAFVEPLLGDLQSLESLQKSILEMAAIASRSNPMVNPTGLTEIQDLIDAENGEPIVGREEDITWAQAERYNDLRVALEAARDLTKGLELAFLLTSAIQRDAERVTAEEIRRVAQELEIGLGGIYSIITQELQRPYLERRLLLMEREGRMPSLPEEIVQVTMTTGLEALGRGNDRQKLTMFLDTISKALGPEATARYLNVHEAIRRLAVSDGIDPTNLIRTAAELQQMDQQAQIMAMVEQLGPNAINQIGGLVQQQQAQGQLNAS